MSYMQMFKRDPLAPASTIKDPRVAQQRRNAPPVKFSNQPSAIEKAGQIVTQKAVDKGAKMAEGYFDENIAPKAKDLFSSFAAAPQVAAPSAVSVAPAVSTTGAGLAKTGADMALSNALAGSATPALAGGAAKTAATTGALTTLGTAVPYIGAGLLAAKAFGLFNKGGKAEGPLYAGMGMLALANKMKEEEMMPGLLGLAMSQGDLVGPLALRKIRYKEDGGKVEIEATMGD